MLGKVSERKQELEITIEDRHMTHLIPVGALDGLRSNAFSERGARRRIAALLRIKQHELHAFLVNFHRFG